MLVSIFITQTLLGLIRVIAFIWGTEKGEGNMVKVEQSWPIDFEIFGFFGVVDRDMRYMYRVEMVVQP